MRSVITLGALSLGLLFAAPASAQMCGGSGQAGATVSGAGMCGGTGGMAAQAPGATPDQSTPQQTGMCGCCRNMAMMMGPPSGQGGSMNMPGMNMPGMNMPGMEAPKPQ